MEITVSEHLPCSPGAKCVFTLKHNYSMFSDPHKLDYAHHSPYPRLLETNMLRYSEIWRVLRTKVMFISHGAGQYPLMKLFSSGKNIWIFSIGELYKDYKILISIQVYILPQMSSGCVTLKKITYELKMGFQNILNLGSSIGALNS